jgi:hypothetical protein
MTQFNQIEYNCRIGVDYPSPVKPPFAYSNSGKPGSNRVENGRGGSTNEKYRKPNRNSRNHHQKYEMTGLKEGRYNF